MRNVRKDLKSQECLSLCQIICCNQRNTRTPFYFASQLELYTFRLLKKLSHKSADELLYLEHNPTNHTQARADDVT